MKATTPSSTRRPLCGLTRRPPTLLAALNPHAAPPGARGLKSVTARPALGALSWCSSRSSSAPASAAPPAATSRGPSKARSRCQTRAVDAEGPLDNNQGGADNSSDDQKRRAGVSTCTPTPGADADADAEADATKASSSPILVFDAAVPPSGLAAAQVERLAAQLLPLLEGLHQQDDDKEQQRRPRRFLVAEGRPGSSDNASSPALAQLASALGATLALSEPPDPRRAFELAASTASDDSNKGLAAAEAAVEAALAEGRRGAPAQAQGLGDEDDDKASSSSSIAATTTPVPFPPSRRLDLPDLALRPRPPEAPGSLRRRNASWQRALELAYFLLQLSAAGIGFRLHRVGDDSSDEDDDSDDDIDIAALMADDSSDDNDDEEEDEDEEDDTDGNDSPSASTGVERSSDASIRLGGPGIWEIFSGKNKQRGDEDGDDAKNDASDDDEDDDEEESGKSGSKRRRNKSLDKARHTLSITFARPDALRGDLGRKLFGGRTRGMPTHAALSAEDEDGAQGQTADEDDAAAADAEAAERARLYRIAEGFETDEGDLPEEEEQPKAPPPPTASAPAPAVVAPTAPTTSALDAIAALEATGVSGEDDEEDEDSPFEVVSVRPESPPTVGEKSSSGKNGEDDDEDEAAATSDADENEEDDDELTDEQMGAVAAEVLADAREGELRGARTLRLTGVGLGDMVLLASGLLAVSQGRDPTKSEMSMLGRLLSEASVVPDDEAAAAANAAAEGGAGADATPDDGSNNNDNNNPFLPSSADNSGWIFGNAIAVPGGGMLLPLRAPAALRLGPGTGRGLGRGRRVARGARRQALLGQDVPVRDDLSPLQRPASEGARGGRDRRARALARARAAARKRREPPGWASVEGGAAAAAAAARRAAGPLVVFGGDGDEEDVVEDSDEEEEEAPDAPAGAYGSFEEEAEEDEEDDSNATAPTTTPSVASLGGLAYASLARLRAEALVRRALELRDQAEGGDPVEVVLLAPPTLAAAVRDALAQAEAEASSSSRR